MICSNCGNEIPNDAVFCPVCGVEPMANNEPKPVSIPTPSLNAQATPAFIPAPAQPAYTPMGNNSNKANKRLITAMIATVGVTVVAIALILFAPSVFVSGPESAAKKAFLASENYDAEAMFKCLPKSVVEAIIDENDEIDDEDDLLDEIKDSMKESKKRKENSYKEEKEDVPEDYKVIKTGTLKLGKEMKEELLDELEDELDDEDIDIEVQDIAYVYYVYSYEQDGEVHQEISRTYVVKIDGKWCSMVLF